MQLALHFNDSELATPSFRYPFQFWLYLFLLLLCLMPKSKFEYCPQDLTDIDM
jgi:hypothetical protein